MTSRSPRFVYLVSLANILPRTLFSSDPPAALPPSSSASPDLTFSTFIVFLPRLALSYVALPSRLPFVPFVVRHPSLVGSARSAPVPAAPLALLVGAERHTPFGICPSFLGPEAVVSVSSLVA